MEEAEMWKMGALKDKEENVQLDIGHPCFTMFQFAMSEVYGR